MCLIFPRKPHYHITYQVPLGSSRLWNFLNMSLFLVIFTLLRTTRQVFCAVSFNCALFDVFLIIRHVFKFGGEESRRKSIISIINSIIILSIWLSTWNPEVMFVNFFHSKVIPFPPFYISLFWSMSLWAAYT